MVILIDTNIVLDVIQGRKPYCEVAADIFTLCAMKKVTGYIALHSVSNIFYILRKSYSIEERRKILKDVLKIFTVTGASHQRVLEALGKEEFKDFEDCLQDECAKEIQADYLVTRNIDDFKESETQAVKPEIFLKILQDMEPLE